MMCSSPHTAYGSDSRPPMAIFELLDYIVNEVGFHHLITFHTPGNAFKELKLQFAFQFAASTKAACNI